MPVIMPIGKPLPFKRQIRSAYRLDELIPKLFEKYGVNEALPNWEKALANPEKKKPA